MSNVNTTKKVFSLLLAAALTLGWGALAPTTAYASNASTIAAAINQISGLSAAVSPDGKSVTVTDSGSLVTLASTLFLSIDSDVTVTWQASVTSGQTSTIHLNAGSGTFEVAAGGAVKNEGTGRALYNTSIGNINISGGVVASGSNNAIYNASTGNVNVSGGTVSSSDSYAIYNASTGVVTVSQVSDSNPTVVSSNGSATATSAIYQGAAAYTGDLIVITGGTVTNNGAGCAVNNSSKSNVSVSGGTVQAAGGHAIYNLSTGHINISGGTVASSSGYAIYNASTGHIGVSGGTVASNTSYAIYNISTGVVTISQASDSNPTVIKSSGAGAAFAIYQSAAVHVGDLIVITGGTVTNSGTGGAIANGSTGNVSISSGAVQAASGYAIYNSSTGHINISGGTVQAAGSGYTVYNSSTGHVNISGGTVSSNGGYTVMNYSTGNVNILGGTASSVSGYAIFNNSTGHINVSGGTVSSGSSNTICNYSTGIITISQESDSNPTIVRSGGAAAFSAIYQANASYTGDLIHITGGTVKNDNTGRAVYNDSAGNVSVSGGTVQAGSGNTIYNSSTGNINISGGAVQSTGGSTIYNSSTGNINVLGGAVFTENNSYAIYNLSVGRTKVSGGVVLGRSAAASGVVYGTFVPSGDITGTGVVIAVPGGAGTTQIEGTSTNIAALYATPTPADASTTWAKRNSLSGVTNNVNGIFVPLSGFSVNEAPVTSVTVKTAPTKITYMEGEVLDLSGLVITLNKSGSASEDINFTDFADRGIATAPINGAVLAATDTAVTITHMASGQTASQTITVNSKPAIKLELLVTSTILEKCAANLPLKVTPMGFSPEAPIVVTLRGADDIVYGMATANDEGVALVKASAFPSAGTYTFTAACDDVYGMLDLEVAPYDLSIWDTTLSPAPDGHNAMITFGATPVPKNGISFDGYVKINGGAPLIGTSIIENAVVIPYAYDELVPGDNIVISGVKYPNFFPSYSFTFTVTVQ